MNRKNLPTENLLEDTDGVLSGAVASCDRFLLTAAVLMTSSHSEGTARRGYRISVWRGDQLEPAVVCQPPFQRPLGLREKVVSRVARMTEFCTEIDEFFFLDDNRLQRWLSK